MKGSRSHKSSAVRARSSSSRAVSTYTKRASASSANALAASSFSTSSASRVRSASSTTATRSVATTATKSAVSSVAARRSFGRVQSSGPELTVPVVTAAKRMGHGHAPVDALGRPLPTDYKMKLHGPYEMFQDETSTIFDPLVFGDQNSERVVEKYAHLMKTLPEEVAKTRATIEDPKELAAYDSIIVPLLTGKFPEGMKPMTAEEAVYDYKAKNKPIPLMLGHHSWGDLFVSEYYTGTTGTKIKFTIALAAIFGSVFSLSYDAITGIQDYWESMGESHDH